MYKNFLALQIVVATGNQGAIGYRNRLLWKMPLDLKFYKNMTWGKTTLMGRKTYESIVKDGNPPAGRQYVVISQSLPRPSAPFVFVCKTIEMGLDFCIEQLHCQKVVIAGGAQIYQQALPIVDEVYQTHVKGDFPIADTFFPVLQQDEWTLCHASSFDADEKHAHPFSFTYYKRKARF